MPSNKALLIATLAGALLLGCKDKPKPSSKSSDDDEPRRETSESSAKPRTSGSAAVAADAPKGSPPDGVVLDRGDQKLAVVVEPDGKVQLTAFDGEGSEISAEEIVGKVRVAENDWVSVGKPGASAKLAPLEDGLTTIELALKVKGKAFVESIDVPEGGTKALLEKSDIDIPEGTKGPNGGTVDVVDGQRVELVVDEETGDLRVYFLNEKLEVIDVPEGTDITINIDDEEEKAEMKRMLVLGTALVALFLLGSFAVVAEAEAAVVQVRVKADVSVPYLVVRPPRPILAPRRITMRVSHGDVGHVRVFGLGHHHRHSIYVGTRAPRFVLRARLTPMSERHPHFAHFDHGHSHGGKVRIDVRGPGFRGPAVHGPVLHGPSFKGPGFKGHGHGGGKFKAGGKFKGKF